MTNSDDISEQQIRDLAHKMLTNYGDDSGLFVAALSACIIAKMAQLNVSDRRKVFDGHVAIMSKAIDMLDKEDRG